MWTIIFWVLLIWLVGAYLPENTAWALTPLPTMATQTRLFRDLDKNGDGMVSLKEYQDSHQACMRDPKCRAWLNNKFSKLDTNRDGVLTLEEFLAPLKKRQQRQEKPPGAQRGNP